MKKLLVILLAVAMLSMNVFATDFIKSEDVMIESFIKEHDVSSALVDKLKKVYDVSNNNKVTIGNFNDKMIEVKKLAETYSFTNDQIEQYIEGIISTPTIIIGAPDETKLLSSTQPKSERIGDDGIGYEIKSNSGYVKQSTFLTLPDVTISNASSSSATSAYMFYSFESGGNAIDVGLWYHYGNGGWGWRDTYLRSFVQEPGQTPSGLINVNDGDNLYMEAGIVYGTDGERYIQCRITNGSNLSMVYSDFSVWVGNGIGSSAVINRQITLCNNKTNFNTGEKIEGAEFRTAKIFTASNGAGTTVGSSNVNSAYCGRFGKYNNDYKQVKVNSYKKWNMENLDIYFDSTMQNTGE